MADLVKIDGLRELQASLRQIDAELPRALRLVLNDAAELVVRGAQGAIPHRSGKAAASLAAGSSQREARVKAGGARVPYFGWLDFGGQVGRPGTPARPFLRDGRYIYASLAANRSAIEQRLRRGMDDLVRSAGFLIG